MTSAKILQLLIIDPQNDFCDLPATWLPANPLAGGTMAPALAVTGAHEDMLRTAAFIRAAGDKLSSIAITLDSHYRLHIAHPTFWKTGTGTGGDVNPFTAITAAQVRAGEYLPRDASTLPRALAYMDELERRGRYTLMVWPVHCEIGSWGQGIHPAVLGATGEWETRRLAIARRINKGSNPWTENYSALQAEVPDPQDPATQLNTALIAELDAADVILVAGEASSHCVRATTEDLIANLPSRTPAKVVLLTDCMSPVGGFEAQHTAFLDDMKARGAMLTTSTAFLATL